MLVELTVKEFAIIEELKLNFHEGFNILSGETGAGKSVLLKSLSLLMGGKASSDIVRSGAKQAIIEGLFDISDRDDVQKQLIQMGVENDGENLVVRRVIVNNGKSRVYLNGSISTLGGLTKVVHPLIQLTGQTAPLIEITGQHESKNLLEKSYHLDILDLYADLVSERGSFENRFQTYHDKVTELNEIRNNQGLLEQKLDFLKFQHKEIESLNLEEGEEINLENKYKSIKNSQKLFDFQMMSSRLLEEDDDSALTRMQKALQVLEGAERYDDELSSLKQNLEHSLDYLSEYLSNLSDYSRKLDNGDEDILEIEDRLSRFRKLQKKYGDTSKEILDHFESIKDEINQMENSDQSIDALSKEVKELELSLKVLAQKLHKKRIKAAKDFSKAVNLELSDLNMKGLEFLIDVNQKLNFDRKGNSTAEFQCKNSKLEDARALAKTASGGELSRILLSIKKVIGSTEVPRTYLFDEVDTGVSGETADKVGRKLKDISQGQQVICVTHLPQVAAQGEHHFYIEKSNAKGRSMMNVLELNKKDRVSEIARLISGEKLTKTSLSHAKELLSLN